MEFMDAIQSIYDFLVVDSYNFIQEIFAQMLIWVATWWVKIKIASIGFFWGVAQAMLDQLGVSDFIQSAWGSLDSNVVNFLTRYKVVEGVNMLISAGLTNFIMRFF